MTSAPLRDVVIGVVVRNHGVDGGLKIRSNTDYPERFKKGNTLFFESSPETPRRITRSRHLVGDFFLLFLEGIGNREEAARCTGQKLVIAENERIRDPQNFYPDELVGCEVHNPDGVKLGVVARCGTAPKGAYLEVEPVGAKTREPIILPIPHPDFIDHWDLKERKIFLKINDFKNLFLEDR